MESHNVSIVTFAENIRKQMHSHKPPLIRHRHRPLAFFRNYTNVFLGSEAVAWAMRTLRRSDKETPDQSGFLTEAESCSLFQKLMDAGLLLNVTNQEQFKNDRSLFRFSSDDVDAEKLIRSVAFGYRVYDRAQASESKLFQKVCALGQLVSCECLKSVDIVTWLVNNGLSLTRESAVAICRDMLALEVLKPVDPDVKIFIDGKDFFMLAIDYKQPALTVDQFLSSNIAFPKEICKENATVRNLRIHLRQTSDQLLDMSEISTEPSNNSTADRRKGISTSSDDSGFDDNSVNLISPSSYQSLLNGDGSITGAALLHPTSPYTKKTLWIYPDPVGYGFVIRGSGPCFVKIVDPDSPAGKAGLKANQYIAFVNQNDVTALHHKQIEDMILSGPKNLKITVMQHKEARDEDSKAQQTPQANNTSPARALPSTVRQRSCPPLPTAQPWIKKKTPISYTALGVRPMRQVVSQ